jgi:hypothetical protein
MRLEDLAGLGAETPAKATTDLVPAANATPGYGGCLFTLFRRDAADQSQSRPSKSGDGVSIGSINEAIETYMGSSYINDSTFWAEPIESLPSGWPVIQDLTDLRANHQ